MIKPRHCSCSHSAQNTAKTKKKEKAEVVFGELAVQCSRSTLWRPEEGVTSKRKKETDEYLTSLENKLNSCHPEDLRNGHRLQFEIQEKSNPFTSKFSNKFAALFSKRLDQQTFYLHSEFLGELNAETLVFVHVPMCTGMRAHMWDGMWRTDDSPHGPYSFALFVCLFLSLAWNLPGRLVPIKPLDLPDSASPVRD